MLLGKSRAELENYLPALTKKSDFEGFWRDTLEQNVEESPKAVLTRVASPSGLTSQRRDRLYERTPLGDDLNERRFSFGD
jgi:hypothetical protein